MLLRGDLAELLVKVDPKLYRKYLITLKQGLSMLYVKLTKTFYGVLSYVVMFYNKIEAI